VEANPSREVDDCSSRFSEMSGKCELGQTMSGFYPLGQPLGPTVVRQPLKY